MYTTAFNDGKSFQRSEKNISATRQEKLKSRAERNLALMKEVEEIIGDDISWASEEEMIRELAEMRRQKLRS